MGYRQNPTLDQMSKEIIELINNEQFFRKDVLIPKVRALMAGFNVNLNTANYNRKESPSDKAKRLNGRIWMMQPINKRVINKPIQKNPVLVVTGCWQLLP